MPIVTYGGKSYDCAVAIKGAKFVHLYDAIGNGVAAWDEVTDFTGFSISDGTWAEGCDPKTQKSATVTLSTTWTGSTAPYSQTVTVPGMTADFVPGVPVVAASSNIDTNKARQEALSCISQITSAKDALTFICYEEKPTRSITISVPGVMV